MGLSAMGLVSRIQAFLSHESSLESTSAEHPKDTGALQVQEHAQRSTEHGIPLTCWDAESEWREMGQGVSELHLPCSHVLPGQGSVALTFCKGLAGMG